MEKAVEEYNGVTTFSTRQLRGVRGTPVTLLSFADAHVRVSCVSGYTDVTAWHHQVHHQPQPRRVMRSRPTEIFVPESIPVGADNKGRIPHHQELTATLPLCVLFACSV
jgi:hypothetical protein